MYHFCCDYEFVQTDIMLPLLMNCPHYCRTCQGAENLIHFNLKCNSIMQTMELLKHYINLENYTLCIYNVLPRNK